jgi:beta-lactamase superfamily II metal-dependent hydrolase
MPELQVIFMDAGQGDCTLLVYPDNSLTLVDCGSTKSGEEAFAQIAVVLSKVLPNNNNTIDTMVLTHPDEDHYNQLRKLLGPTATNPPTVDWIYYGGDIKLYKHSRESNFTYNWLKGLKDNDQASPPKNSVSFAPNARLSRSGVNVTILSSNMTGNPSGKAGAIKNSNSIVLLVEYQGSKLYLMGDAFIATEKFIKSTFDSVSKLGGVKPDFFSKGQGEQSLLKLGHHGSDTSTGDEWVTLTNPDIMVVSSGTKRFRGKGMPTADKIDHVTSLTTLTTTPDISQSYVVFDPANRGKAGKDFFTRPKTTTAIWCTCFQVEWMTSTARWFESGQTWYYGVEVDKKKKASVWYGYTGYEEDDDVDEDEDG